jgi:ElaB/YqjD/DUF883 family membrane-anchored ribosome-binding protein
MAEFEEEVLEAKRSFGDKIDELRQKAQGKAKDMIEEFKGKAQDKAHDLREELSREVTLFKQKNLDNITKEAREYIVENPGKSVAFALVAGFVVGILLKRR